MSEQPIHTSTFNAITSVQKSRHHKEYNNPYAKKQFLIVDSVPEMQRALAMTLASFGAEKVEYAGKASDALVKLMRYDFDVVLCDFDLGTGNDGLYLLEEAKERNLLKQSCVFMIVSGEWRRVWELLRVLAPGGDVALEAPADDDGEGPAAPLTAAITGLRTVRMASQLRVM